MDLITWKGFMRELIPKAGYKLVLVEYNDKMEEPVVTLKVDGQNDYLKVSLSALFNQEIRLEGFGIKDIQTIVELRTRWMLSPQIKLVSHFVRGCSTQVVFHDKKGNITLHEVKQVGRQAEVINQLSSNDAFLLGYLLADEHTD